VIELGKHQAKSWKHPQRLILVVVDKPDSKTGQLDLLPLARRFQQSVLRASGRVVKHARRLWLHVEESVGSFWKVLTRRVGQLRLASRWTAPQGARRRDWVPPPRHSHLPLVLRG